MRVAAVRRGTSLLGDLGGPGGRIHRGRGDEAMSPVSRGFRGRRESAGVDVQARVPPGQYVTGDFPVLSAGPTPKTPLSDWTFSIRRGGEAAKTWTWSQLQALPSQTFTADI